MSPEETTLIEQAQAGSLEAQAALIEKNMAMVYRIAKKQLRRFPRLDIEDLLQAGRMGILKAIEKFDLTRGFGFLTYATRWIFSYCQRTADASTLIHIPANAQYEQSEDTQRARGVKLSGELVDEESSPFDYAAEVREQAFGPDEIERLQKTIARLPERLRKIVEWRQFEELTLREIGVRLSLSKERVRQLEVEALTLLAKRLKRKLGPSIKGIRVCYCDGCDAAFERRVSELEFYLKKGLQGIYCSRRCFRENGSGQRFFTLKGRRWLPAEDQYLRANYQALSQAVMGKALQRTENAVSARLSKLGLLVNRPWTDAEINFLKENYRKIAPATLAAVLERPWRNLTQAAHYYGLSLPIPKLSAEQETHARSLYEEGRGDQEIADLVGSTVAIVLGWRRRHGLKNNRGTAYFSAKRRRACTPERVRARCTASARNAKAAAAAMGWPQADTPTQARLLSQLASGPRTRAELSSGTLQRLMERGLVRNVGPVGEQGKRYRTSLFGLAEGVVSSKI